MNRRTLIVAILEVRSSYIEDRQEPAERETPDTVQWWVAPDLTWRIRTFAIDHDLHLHHVNGGDPDVYMEHTREDFDGLVRAMHRFDFENYEDAAEVGRTLSEAGLRPDLEIADQHGFAFWNPDQGVYKTRSYPEE